MVYLNRRLTGNQHQLVGLGLQLSAAALHHLGRPFCQADKEGIHFLAHFGGSAKASVGRNLFANPIPDGLERLIILHLESVGRHNDYNGSINVGGPKIPNAFFPVPGKRYSVPAEPVPRTAPGRCAIPGEPAERVSFPGEAPSG